MCFFSTLVHCFSTVSRPEARCGTRLSFQVYVIANLGDSIMRARLAKGTTKVLGAQVPVAAGSDGGRKDEETPRLKITVVTMTGWGDGVTAA